MRVDKMQTNVFFPNFLNSFFGLFRNIWLLAGPNIAKEGWPLPQARGVIDRPIFELLTFGSNPDFCDFGSNLDRFEQNWP